MKITIIFLLLLCFLSPILHAQTDTTEETAAESSLLNEDKIFVINSFNYNIDGLTKRFALVEKADLKIGEEIKGQENLEKYIQDKTQLLMNQRVLDKVSIDYTLDSEREDGKIPVNLTINTKDTWNIIALPHPKYDTNTGFDIKIKARDYNFLGTMVPIRLDFGYRYDEEKRDFFNFLLDSDTPFFLFGLIWSFKFENFYEYRTDMSEQHYLYITTGISVNIPVKTTTLTIGFDESFILNEENSDTNIKHYGLSQFQDGLYMSSKPYISWKIPTGLEVFNWGELTYTPRLSFTFNHELNDPLDSTRIGPFINFGHRLEFGRIDWIGNFRKGLSASIDNSYKYDFYKLDPDPYPWLNRNWNGSLRFSVISHNTFEDVFGISARAMVRYWYFNKPGEKTGDALRGILDKSLTAYYMYSLNADFSAKIFSFKPSNYFENDKLRIMNFDLLLTPFLDTAIYQSPEIEEKYKKADFTYKNLLMAGGAELIIYPDFFRSLSLRISLGFNLLGQPNKSEYEIFIGTDLHY